MLKNSYFHFVVGSIILTTLAACEDTQLGDFSEVNLAASSLASTKAGQEYSVYTPGNRYSWGGDDYYVDEIQAIFSKRCVSCHSCTAGPCQLNLTSYEGFMRGMSKDNPYDVWRLFSEVPRARLEDHYTVEQWREIGFAPVSAMSGDPITNEEESIMYLALTHGENNNQQSKLYNDSFDEETIDQLGMHQEEENYQCPVNAEEYRAFEKKFPYTGMPFGCPALEENFAETLKEWISADSPGPTVKSQLALLTPQETQHSQKDPLFMVNKFESFLNQDDLEHQAVARYVYEHMWVNNVHFKENPGEFFRIVRSRTPAPESIDLIVSEFATDAPGDDVERVYYRLEKLDRVIEMKKHILWDMDLNAVTELENMFFDTDWTIEKLPAYPLNPFEWFDVIPVRKRALFVQTHMLHMLQSIARGSICHGRLPSYVGADYAWYFMLDSDSDPTVLEPKLGMNNYDSFYTHPYDKTEHPAMPLYLLRSKPHRLRDAFERTLRKYNPEGLGFDDISDEEFIYGIRHETSMEFFSGLTNPIPGYPKYKLVFSYADLENFYYRLAVHLKFWGSLMHKGETFVDAVYVLEGAENTFVSLNANQTQRDALRSFLNSPIARLTYRLSKDRSRGRPSKISSDLTYEDISLELLKKFRGTITTEIDNLNNWPLKDLDKTIYSKITNLEQWESGLRALTAKEAPYARYVPNAVHIRLDKEHLYTLFVERGHKNNRIPTQEKSDREPAKDIVRAFKGYVGPFPHMFFDLDMSETASFLSEFSNVKSLEDWINLSDLYKIPRNSEEFWPFVDWIHDWISQNMKAEGAIVDMRNYDIRDEPF